MTFNEITKRAVQEAFEHPRAIDQNLVDAQQARRVLDRLVGYQVSPLLWDKVRRGLSAGRVQTVALRLIVEREREIKAFEKKEYWTIDANLAASKPPAFDARFLGKGEEKVEVTNGEEAEKIRAALEKADWMVRSVEKKERRRNAAPPFTTSKLQQDSSRKLRFSVKRTMMIAQRLYEGVELGEEGSVGLITYMRTDSTRVAPEAIQEVREYVGKEYGADYLPEAPNTFKEKKDSQGAHEAIRPTSAMRHPDQIKQYLKEDEFKVYKLIWQRFVASQINARGLRPDHGRHRRQEWQRSLLVPRDRIGPEVRRLPASLRRIERRQGRRRRGTEAQTAGARSGTEAHAERVEAGAAFHRAAAALQRSVAGERTGRTRHRPPVDLCGDSDARFRSGSTCRKSAASLRRPKSAWSSPICWWKTSATFSIVQYTARLEEELDEIEEGKEKWTDALAEFYKKFQKDLKYAEKHMENIKRMEKPTDEKCERCGSPLVIKWGKHGSFYACSTYDKEDPNTCTFTKENPINLPDLDSADVQETTQEEYCENCGRVMVLKRGRFGQFMACTGYPDCKTTRRLDQGKRVPDIPLDELVPEVRAQHDDPPRALRRVHGVQRISRVQVCEAEFHRREVPRVQRRRTGRKARAQGQHVLRLRKLSEVQVHFGAQADCGEVPELRQRISGGEKSEGRAGDCVSE